MSTPRTATIADVVHSVCTCDGLDINLGNGHILSCSVKKAVDPTDN